MLKLIRYYIGLLFILLLGVVVYPQAQTPTDHPQLPSNHPKNTVPARARLSRLTEETARSSSQPGIRPVPVRNYIDEFILGKMKKDGIPYAGLTTDAEFLRRVHLDLTGRLPDPDAVRKFLADKDPDKRGKMIESLMTTPPLGQIGQIEKPETPFLDRWTYFFGDLYRVTSSELGEGRNLFRNYLYLALLANMPYNELVKEMLTARARTNWLDAPSNFLMRDHVDDFNDLKINNEDTYDEMAITTSKIFLGVNLECVSCHAGKGHLEKINLGLSRIEREQLWRQAAFFSKLRIDRAYSIGQEMTLLEDGKGYDVTTNSVRRMPRYKTDLGPRFLLTGESPKPGEPWREAYARMLTEHPQFAKATVNLIWAELMGVGIVDPPLEFDLARQDPANPPPAPWGIQPSHPELLETLAKDFRDHNFDLRYIIRLITNSSAYQLSSYFEGEWKEPYAPYFARHFARRLRAEEICDAISQATGIFNEVPIGGSNKKVKYVMQTYSPEDIVGKELEPMRQLLLSLGQNNRDMVVAKDNTGSTLQASVLLNSKYVKDRIRVQENGRLSQFLNHDPPYSNEQIVEEIFLAFLSRNPLPKEKAIALQTLQERHGHGLEDLAWSLINKPEFYLND
jgi:hypothetical protein